jgi:transcriptional regulator with PAS, ATPase and Fis domain
MEVDHRYKLIFEELLDKTDDGFIVIDADGVITDINQNYCDFLARKKEDVIGRQIGTVISTTSMYDVLKKRHRGDVANGIYFQPYLIEGNSADQKTTYAIANRFCVFNEDGNVIAAAAQMKFKQRAMIMASRIFMEEVKYYKEEYQNSTTNTGGFDKLIGNNPKLVELKKKGARISKTDFPVLITGETGTGKELFAKALHVESDRRDKPFICINCGAIPSELLESELFGYEEGAFTGAKKGGKIGKFQLADGGTIFLDEIGDMPPNLQVKLLRALQEHEIEKVGGNGTIPIDSRVISATRQNLQEMMKRGTFREDLYYRLNVINFDILPLRERVDDILLYANYFLEELNKKYKSTVILSDTVKRYLREYSWPGNVRELNNVISSAYASCDKFMISVTDLPNSIVSNKRISFFRGETQKRLGNMVDEYEAAIIRETLHRHKQNVKSAAEELGVERSLLYKKMKRLNIVLQKTTN